MQVQKSSKDCRANVASKLKQSLQEDKESVLVKKVFIVIFPDPDGHSQHFVGKVNKLPQI